MPQVGIGTRFEYLGRNWIITGFSQERVQYEGMVQGREIKTSMELDAFDKQAKIL